jgi:hypothetical protein
MLRVVTALALAGALAGCASATRGWTEQIAISTTPEGANARIDGGDQHECVTPCTVTVRRNADVTVHLNKPGYRPETVALTKEISAGGAAGFAGNIIAGGAVGMVVDAASGATLEHRPNPVTVTMQPMGQTPSAAGRPAPRRPAKQKQAPPVS